YRRRGVTLPPSNGTAPRGCHSARGRRTYEFWEQGPLGSLVPPPAVGRRERFLADLGKCLADLRSEEHTSELQSRENLVCRLLRARPPPWSPRFPYTPLFRSLSEKGGYAPAIKRHRPARLSFRPGPAHV